MFDSRHFLLFLAAAFLLAITPGPGIFYVLARSLAGGRREGVLSSLGTFVGGSSMFSPPPLASLQSLPRLPLRFTPSNTQVPPILFGWVCE